LVEIPLVLDSTLEAKPGSRKDGRSTMNIYPAACRQSFVNVLPSRFHGLLRPVLCNVHPSLSHNCVNMRLLSGWTSRGICNVLEHFAAKDRQRDRLTFISCALPALKQTL
jgi:hypothetical protein